MNQAPQPPYRSKERSCIMGLGSINSNEVADMFALFSHQKNAIYFPLIDPSDPKKSDILQQPAASGYMQNKAEKSYLKRNKNYEIRQPIIGSNSCKFSLD